MPQRPLGYEPRSTLGVNSDIYEREWEVFMRHRQELLDSMLGKAAVSSELDAPGMSDAAKFYFANAAGMEHPTRIAREEQRVQAGLPPLGQMRDLDELLGAAQFHGIPNAESMHPQELMEVVQQRRSAVRDLSQGRERDAGDMVYEGIANAIGLLGTALPDALMELGLNAVAHVPFIGGSIARSKTAREADRWFAQIQEGFTADLPEERALMASGAAGMVGYAGASYMGLRFLGLAGKLPAAGTIGARLSPLGRVLATGGFEAAVADPTAPLIEQGVQVALGLGFGVGEHIGGAWGRRAMGGALGALGAGLASDQDPEAMAIGALTAAAGFDIVPRLAGRLQRSFPTRSFGGIDAQAMPNDLRDPVVDAPWQFEDAPQIGAGPRQLGPGPDFNAPPQMPGGPGLPPGYYEAPPVSEMTAAGGPFEVGPGFWQNPQGRSQMTQLRMREAAAEGSQLAKHSAVMESPALAELVNRAKLDDADVARAVVDSYPGQVAVVRNVGDVASTVRKMVQERMENGVGPQDFRVVQVKQPPPPAVGRQRLWRAAPVGEVVSPNAARTGIPGPGVQSTVPGRWYQDHPGAVEGVSVAQESGYSAELRYVDVPGDVTNSSLVDESEWFLPVEWAQQSLPVVRTDILVTNGLPISNKMVKEYERHGMFSGQRALTHDGLEVQIVSVGDDVSMVRQVSGGTVSPVSTQQLVPLKGSMPDDVPCLYEDFSSFAQVKLDMQARDSGIAAPPLYSDAGMGQTPLLIEDFLNEYGINQGYHRATLQTIIERQFIENAKQLMPEDLAVLRGAQHELDVMRMESGSMEMDSEMLAEAKGMQWIPGKGSSIILRDQLSDLEVPVADEAAAIEFLTTFDRDLPDVTPGDLAILPEFIEHPIGYNPDSPVELRARGAAYRVKGYQDMLDSVDGLNEMSLMEGGGGSGGFDDGPPGGMPPFGPGRLGAGPPPRPRHEIFGEEIRNLRNDHPKKLQAIIDYVDSAVTQYTYPMRNLLQGLENRFIEAGVHNGRAYIQFDALEASSKRASTAATPWLNEVNELYKGVRSKFWHNGVFREVHEAPTILPDGSRPQAELMAKYGYTEADRQAHVQYKEMMDRFLFTEARQHSPDIGYYEQYIPAVRQRVAELPADRRLDAWDALPESLGWMREMMRKGKVDPLEKDMGVILSTYFRGFYKHVHMKDSYEAMKNTWLQPGVPKQVRELMEDYLEIKLYGVDPSADKLIVGARKALRAVKIPVTDRDINTILTRSLGMQYRGLLGGRPDVVVRDLLQPLMLGARVGFKPLGVAYKRFAESKESMRDMIDFAYRSGALKKQQVHVADTDIMNQQIAGAGSEGSALSPRQEQFRESFSNVVHATRDAVPLLKTGLQGTKLDPLYAYGKEGDLNIVITANTGRFLAEDALANFRQRVDAGAEYGVAENMLLEESRVLMYPLATKREFIELAKTGQHQEAIEFFARVSADSQLRYGGLEQPPGIRDMGAVGRMITRWGTYPHQTMAQAFEVAFDKTIPWHQRVGAGLRIGAIQTALGTVQLATGWNLRKLMLGGVLLGPPAGGLFALTNKIQQVRASMKEDLGEPMSPEEKGLLGAAQAGQGSAIGDFLGTLNPYAGVGRTLQGTLDAAMSSNPAEQVPAFLTLGQRTDPWIARMQERGQYGVGPQQAPVYQQPSVLQPGQVDDLLRNYPLSGPGSGAQY